MVKELASYVLIGLISIGGIFAIGKVSNIYEATIGTEYKNVKREQFENSTSYVHGMINDLSKNKREYELAESEEEKQAILNYIDSSFSEFDINKIDNQTLKDFLLDVRNGNL